VPRSLGFKDRKLLLDADEVIGVDEVGRGCLAGPVVVCAVAFCRIPRNPLVQDSKVLTPRHRGEAADWVRNHCVRWLVTEVWVDVIDRVNILEATRLAMEASVRTLSCPGAVAIVDQVSLGDVGCPVIARPKADSQFFSVAAASVVAKVHRDELMNRLALEYPEWGWKRNKGYGTKEHRSALQENGRSYLHRKSFRWSPVLP
jgi:ribonuclease HII